MRDVFPWILVVLGGFLGGLAGKTIHSELSRRRSRRRDERVIGYIRARYPEAEDIVYITVGPNEKAVIENIERRLRDGSKHF